MELLLDLVQYLTFVINTYLKNAISLLSPGVIESPCPWFIEPAVFCPW